MSWFSRLLI